MTASNYDASSVEAWADQQQQLKELQEKLKLDQTARRTVIRSLRNIPAFQALMVELFAWIRPDLSTFCYGVDEQGNVVERDPHGRIAAHNEGRRAVWLLITELLRPTPETHLKEASNAKDQ